jgi:dolichol-phosphate mannosyltransferase
VTARGYHMSAGANRIGLTLRRSHEETTRHPCESLDDGALDHQSIPVLSVVVPARNEAPSLPQLIDEIIVALRPLRNSGTHGLSAFEIVVVDDASTDKTSPVLMELSAVYPEVRWLGLATPVGQSCAIAVGIRAARGTWIATLDADLQNDPADLVRLWNALPGYDGALGWRLTRHDVFSKRLISLWANRVRNAVLGQAVRDTGCAVRIFSRDMALRLPTFRGMHRFIGPLLLREGCNLIQVPVNHRPRQNGCSHYNLWNRSLCVIVDLLGVSWLLHRPVRYQVVRKCQPPEMVAPSSSQDTVSARYCA